MFRVASKHRGISCPDCGQWTERVHSTYYRTVQDVPLCGIKVFLRIRVRKFFCDNPSCERKIIAEQFDDFICPSQRKTNRLNDVLLGIGYSLGGNPGVRLASLLGISVGKDTLLRKIKSCAVPEPQDSIDVVGIDDWAYRRGQRYGTIVCDLERHRLVDVLPDRTVTTVATWLKEHPSIRIVSRDRSSSYADAIRQGLPNATQVADRWHLLKNLGDAVERYFAAHQVPPREEPISEPAEQSLSAKALPTKKEQEQSHRREAKCELIQQVHELRHDGLGIRAIGRNMGLSRQTVRKYLSLTEPPQTTQRQSRKTLLDPYREKVIEMLSRDQTGPKILKQIREQGYKGSRSTLSQYLAELRRCMAQGQIPLPVRRHRVTPRSAAKLLITPDADVDDEDKPYLAKLLAEVEHAQVVQTLARSFKELMDRHDSQGLEGWLKNALGCGVREIRSFAEGIQQDFSAVAAGFLGPWSNGQVEGQVNRLKTLKRQMYGRAGFTLLRARVLHRA
ncbi:ISL3 family transposase [Alicyclobacillus tolerans]|uniref:ISL3 family transposase n=1 Tax=Alicyclobacillus tolerans TaxID=90970 RepID=UPI001F0022CE|nr:ISL3 family transposase [Alicyclobacillus tolerans]MCF8568616.1 ISL3 family transposase [Alicyclobacillus tolerans]